MIELLGDIVLVTMLAITAVAINRMRNLFAATMLAGIFSLLSAGLFVTLDAVDVAFTEAAVGAGIATILFLSTLAAIGGGGGESRLRHSWTALALVIVTGALLVYGTLDMPRFGDAASPVHRHVNPYYLANTETEIGVPNVVTAVLASYRGYDTLGEVIVIFTAAVGVLVLLGRGHRRDPDRLEG